MENTHLLIIDPQNDFCDPRGSLYVKGAEDDSKRLSLFINRWSKDLNKISVTLDSHHLYDIAHSLYWKDSMNNHPKPFTIIKESDLREREWYTSQKKDEKGALEYLKALEKRGKYNLCIWPDHCLIGSWGTQIQEDIFNSLTTWERDRVEMVNKIYKGSNPGTEHYGAFEAEIPQDNDENTKMQIPFLRELDKAEQILIAGEALDYCIANSVLQLVENINEKSLKKIYLLKDCMSSVDSSSPISKSFLGQMDSKGLNIINSSDL